MEKIAKDVLSSLNKENLNFIPVKTQGYTNYNLIKVGNGFLRPINKELFTFDIDKFSHNFEILEAGIEEVKAQRKEVSPNNIGAIDSALYTLIQSIGLGLDFYTDSNTARKNFGMRFEDFWRCLMNELNITNKPMVLSLPIDHFDHYTCEIDSVLSKDGKIRTTKEMTDANEIYVSLKTTSKDRMAKIFIDKYLLEKFCNGKKLKMIGVFHNDIQRIKNNRISGTFVANNFYIYQKHFLPLDGIYYLDIPKKAKDSWYKDNIKTISTLIFSDIWHLLDSTNHI
ncbi:hypothetical protein [Candidatus Methanoperedens nitratireducens]|uniref:Uncharacterized protein n=1 Tax=Candidatus Methanoperedens nitratireducens TaxID=1392998 RepID=A0A284VU88_9EURY|nr:hypothetical protein [Candidatus Methanoperedens nitroreducens]SNQ62748.1 conserved hypothetical protein [Candidatus Methanoperedens nitroreducens]